MDFRSTHVFSVKKEDNSANFTAGGIISLRTHITHCLDTTAIISSPVYVMVYKGMRHVTLPRMRELSPAPT
jgi:hypothetical protein